MPVPRIGRPDVVYPIVPRLPRSSTRRVEARDLGTYRDVLYALSQGGKTIAGIIREKKLDMTRQRAQQLLHEDYGIEAKKIVRTVEWYARNAGKPRLAKRGYVKKGICRYSLKGFAKRLKISEAVLRRICRMHQVSPPLSRGTRSH